MPKAPRRPPPLRGRIFRGSTAISRGLLTRNDLRSSAWRPLFRDVYADAALRITDRQRCRAALRWLLPAGSAIAGRSAAALYGVGQSTIDGPIDVLVPTAPTPHPTTTDPPTTGTATTGALTAPTSGRAGGCRKARRIGPTAGLRIHRALVERADVVERDGVTVTTPARTCWDVARWHDVVEAVVIIEALLARRLVTVPALRDYALTRAGRRGWRAMLRAVGLADPGAESPQESRTRVRLQLAGLPRPRTQWVVTDGGRFVARLDLAWPECKVAVEYDGLWHDEPGQLHHDRRRLNRLLGGEWIVLHVTSRRLREDFDGFVAEVRAALRSRGLPSRPRP
ncbi:endonuclease domain-containing protein [Micromonospora endolithica]|uniref:DUF559 domain-containing protein n=1 Tax=Micromonospora endolithica TaxID=230091 RepID=A0A3A9ZBM0_9ACTN|nr:hypothetical protein [Micromonospora endolithica]RKN45499.1 hypothetical protein D7223_18085 [Micromonospora endolithica]TWJ22771.1 very-short-patch-repair endonuclease [Micromonospora endolithica]